MVAVLKSSSTFLKYDLDFSLYEFLHSIKKLLFQYSTIIYLRCLLKGAYQGNSI